MIEFDVFPDLWTTDGATPVSASFASGESQGEPFNDFTTFAAAPSQATVGLGRVPASIDSRHAALMVVRLLVED